MNAHLAYSKIAASAAKITNASFHSVSVVAVHQNGDWQYQISIPLNDGILTHTIGASGTAEQREQTLVKRTQEFIENFTMLASNQVKQSSPEYVIRYNDGSFVGCAGKKVKLSQATVFASREDAFAFARGLKSWAGVFTLDWAGRIGDAKIQNHHWTTKV